MRSLAGLCRMTIHGSGFVIAGLDPQCHRIKAFSNIDGCPGQSPHYKCGFYPLPFSASPISSSTWVLDGGRHRPGRAVRLSLDGGRADFPDRFLRQAADRDREPLKAATGLRLSRTSARRLSRLPQAPSRRGIQPRSRRATSPLIASLHPSPRIRRHRDRGQEFLLPPVESRWPATFMMSSVRPSTTIAVGNPCSRRSRFFVYPGMRSDTLP